MLQSQTIRSWHIVPTRILDRHADGRTDRKPTGRGITGYRKITGKKNPLEGIFDQKMLSIVTSAAILTFYKQPWVAKWSISMLKKKMKTNKSADCHNIH